MGDKEWEIWKYKQIDKQNISQFMRQSAADKTNFFILYFSNALEPRPKI